MGNKLSSLKLASNDGSCLVQRAFFVVGFRDPMFIIITVTIRSGCCVTGDGNKMHSDRVSVFSGDSRWIWLGITDGCRLRGDQRQTEGNVAMDKETVDLSTTINLESPRFIMQV